MGPGRRTQIPRVFAALVFACLLCDRSASAHGTVQTWDSRAGLDQHSVEALAQTSDGYLWLGTSAGLVRFDGHGFTRFLSRNHPGLASDRIVSLEADGELLWIATLEGIGLLVDGDVRAVQGGAGASRGSAAVPGGGVWVAMQDGTIFASAMEPAARALEAAVEGYPGNPLFSSDGAAWIADVGPGRVLRWDPTDGRVTGFAVPDTHYLDLLLELPDGGILAAAGLGLYRLDQEVATLLYDDVGDARSALLRDDGTLVLTTRQRGALILEPDLVVRGPLPGVPAGGTLSLLRDREQNLWVGTAERGLVRLAPNAASSLQLPSDLRGRSVPALMEDSADGLWVSVPCAGVVRLVHGAPERRLFEQLENPCVWSIAEEPAGTLWFGSWGGGLSRYDLETDTVDRTWGEPDGLHPAVLAIEPDPSGGLWLGTEAGLYRLEDGLARAVLVEGLGQVHSLRQGPDDRLWIATASGVFALGRHGAEQVSEVAARDVHFLPDGTLLATYGEGLVLLGRDGQSHAVGRELGFEDYFLGRFFEDPQGLLWITGNSGLVRVDPAELTAALRDHTHVPGLMRLTSVDGLPSTECNGGGGSAGFIDEAGLLHVPTIAGVGLVDTAALASRRAGIPTPRIEWIRTPRRDFEPPAAPLHLDADERELEIGFTGLLLSAPEQVRFRYRMDSGTWKQAGRQRTLLLSHLGPGDHLFEVQTRLAGADWSQSASAAFHVCPATHETGWFRWGLAALLTLGVLLMIRHFRRREGIVKALVDDRTRELAEANAQLAERANQDGLTGVGSRRLFDDRLELYWQAARRGGAPLSLLMVDVDRFKSLNDRCGHPAGDSCLRQIARRLSDQCPRAIDLVARYGGEEFAVLLPDTDADGAERVARRLWEAVRDRTFEVAGVLSIDLTISIGVASRRPEAGLTARDLVAAADRALYRAKEAGRDRVLSD